MGREIVKGYEYAKGQFVVMTDEDLAKTRFNPGNILDDQREYQAALILFRDAAALDPAFADAHFNLALKCEQLGLVDEAQRHWQRYLALGTQGRLGGDRAGASRRISSVAVLPPRARQ